MSLDRFLLNLPLVGPILRQRRRSRRLFGMAFRPFTPPCQVCNAAWNEDCDAGLHS
jgi:hypothetical protein